MTKPTLLIAALAGCLFFTKANAQVDTTHFDLGRTQLKKEFTQNVTVKGADLEKMPFDNLAEAINVWFYGAYTNKTTLVYIIDGNLANDINAYSIYDIDEVTLVQNAVTALTGAAQNQQLILIKTKRPKGRGYGVTASGQANISSLYTNNIFNTVTNTYETGQKSTNTIYQQYNVSAYKNTDKIQFGVSANYLRDALPVIKQAGVSYDTPENFDRLRFNGYFDAKLGSSLLDITAGYAPQKEKLAETAGTPDNELGNVFTTNEHIWNGSVKLTTQIIPGLTNTLHGDYNIYHNNEDYLSTVITTGNSSASADKSNTYSHTIVAYDNLGYNAKFGNWGLEPAVNLSFRTLRDSVSYVGVNYDQNGESISYNTGSVWASAHMFLLTPSVNLYYKNYFNIEGGLLYNIATIGNLSYTVSKNEKKVLPFVSASADVTRLIDPQSPVSVKIYGSYSLSDFLADDANSLQDFTNIIITQLPIIGSVNNSETSSYSGYGIPYYFDYLYQVNNRSKTLKNFSAGLSITPLKSGITLSYYFERKNYFSPVFMYVPYGPNITTEVAVYDNTNAFLHSVRLDYSLVNGTAFHWQTGINATMLKQKYQVASGPEPSSGDKMWTGGWVNRLSYNSFSAGVDVLYQTGEKLYTTVAPDYNVLVVNKINSFSLQNIYAGYRIKAAGVKNLEIFANGRNLFQNKKADITDNRKYYGLGFRVSL